MKLKTTTLRGSKRMTKEGEHFHCLNYISLVKGANPFYTSILTSTRLIDRAASGSPLPYCSRWIGMSKTRPHRLGFDE
jgi:hypothetical protein